MNEPTRCHWCGRQYTVTEFYPTCSEEHLVKLRDGQTAHSPPVAKEAKEAKIKLWAKFANHQYASWSALFELITGFKPPKMKDVADLISGH